MCRAIKTVAEVAGLTVFSEIQEVFYFPIRRTKAVNAVGAIISFDSGEVPDCECVPTPGCIHAYPFCSLRNLPLPTLAFIQAWRLQSLHSRVEK